MQRKRGAPTRETFRAAFQVTETNLEAGTFSGYASVFGSRVNTWCPTVVERGAFTKTLAEQGGRVRILFQHNPDWPIGLPIELAEDERGLKVTGKISDTQHGRDALTLLRDGVLTEMSIGFDPIVTEDTPLPEAPTDPHQKLRHLKEVRLWEISLVTFAADPMALIAAVHAAHGGQPVTADMVTKAFQAALAAIASVQATEEPDPAAADGTDGTQDAAAGTSEDDATTKTKKAEAQARAVTEWAMAQLEAEALLAGMPPQRRAA